MIPSSKPLLIYDGDCGFCKRWVQRAKRVTGDRVVYRPYQEAAQDFPQIPLEEFQHAVQLFEPNGRHTKAAEAAFRVLAVSVWWWWLLFLYRFLPGFKWMSEAVYRWVAAHRSGDCALAR